MHRKRRGRTVSVGPPNPTIVTTCGSGTNRDPANAGSKKFLWTARRRADSLDSCKNYDIRAPWVNRIKVSRVRENS